MGEEEYVQYYLLTVITNLEVNIDELISPIDKSKLTSSTGNIALDYIIIIESRKNRL